MTMVFGRPGGNQNPYGRPRRTGKRRKTDTKHETRPLDQPSRDVCRDVDRREGYRCLRCGRSIETGGNRHHRQLRSHLFHDKHRRSNLILVCRECHEWFHRHPAVAERYGWIVTNGEEPETTPVLTYRHKWVYLDDSGGFKPLTDSQLDKWMLLTGLKWKAVELTRMVGRTAVITQDAEPRGTGRLDNVYEDTDGAAVAVLKDGISVRLENNMCIRFTETSIPGSRRATTGNCHATPNGGIHNPIGKETK
jgi:hypothetical protein